MDDYIEIEKINVDTFLQAMVDIVGPDETEKILNYYSKIVEKEKTKDICCRCEENISVLRHRIEFIETRVQDLELNVY